MLIQEWEGDTGIRGSSYGISSSRTTIEKAVDVVQILKELDIDLKSKPA